MEVDQHMNLFRETLPTNNLKTVINTTHNPFYNVGMNSNNDSFLPFYNLNYVVSYQQEQQKISPAVKDDSGITFNNSTIIQQQQTTSRKRPREVISCVAPQQLLTVNRLATCTAPNSASRTISAHGINKESNDLSFLGEDLSLHVMQQQLELDRLISHHMEKMRIEIEERKKHQMRKIITVVEESMGRRLRDKGEELEKIGKVNWALEEKVKSLCVENQIWRDLAQTNEATANALRINLEQVMQQMKDNVERTAAADDVDDAVSCCGSGGQDEVERDDMVTWKKCKVVVAENGENGWIYRGKSGNGNGRMCRTCGEGENSVLLLPCRHLCLCTTCGPAVNSCPICNTVKNASVHINLS